MEQMKLFIEAIETDNAFSEEIHALLQEGKITELLEAAARKGFSITEADLREYMEGNSREELPEESLEGISGGSQGNGTISSPFTSESCWYLRGESNSIFHCKRISCKAVVLDDPYGQHPLKGDWYQCSCWGTPRCVNSRHHVNHACQ